MKKIVALILAVLMLLSVGFAFADTAPGFYDEDTGRIRMTHKRYIRPDFVDRENIDEFVGIFEFLINGVATYEKDDLLDALYNTDFGDKIYMDLVDAEKYAMEGYDDLLCWMATAANMLWEAGYPQKCNSPFTGRPFESPDEVFDFFRQVNDDEGGWGDNAVAAFLTLYGYDPASVTRYELLGWADGLDLAFLGFNDYTYGIAVRSIDPVTDMIPDDGIFHDVTVTGIVYDEDGLAYIVLADSDNNKLNHPPHTTAPWERPRAAMASNYPDAVEIYPLEKIQVQDPITGEYDEFWQIVGYAEYTGYPTIITLVYELESLN